MSLETLPERGGQFKTNIDKPTDQQKSVGIVQNDFEESMPGIEIGEVATERLALMERHSEFNQDSRQIEKIGLNVLQVLKEKDERFNLNARELAEFSVGAKIHDVGKVGPVEANKDQQDAILKVYAVKGKMDPTQSLQGMIKDNFNAEEAEKLLLVLGGCMSVLMNMRDFYASHAKWGYEILYRDTTCRIPEASKRMAALHHMDKNDADYTFGLDIGNDPKDIIRQTVLMIVDQYQAAVFRSKLNHLDAIKRVREDPTKKPREGEYVSLVLDTMESMTTEQILSGIM